jgi:hypothetical protein
MYYDGTKLLSLKDIDGNKPEIYIVTTNRTGGKTTYFNKMLVKRFIKQGKKFCLLYRYAYELDAISEKFFKDIKALFFNDYNMSEKKRAKGTFIELFLQYQNDEMKSCGYAVALNKADQLKKYSHLLSDTTAILFDEFMSENGEYCTNEIAKFYSIHSSIARGRGSMYRYVPVYMCANPVTMLNPYYSALGISDRLNNDTKFLRGHGWVMEQGYNDTAATAQKESAFYRAFSATEKYAAYGAQGVYLSDNNVFIDSPQGRSQYLATIRYNGEDFAIRSFPNLGIVYCDNKTDETFPNKIAITTEDHNINYIMLTQYSLFIQQLRVLFERGAFRFKNLKCKQAILTALSYH